ncbi:hypothetical protein MEA186_28782 [Mesorhizobium amorphae CCNWGS0123]|uniref:Uncharacterized protein n=1 Tax=Mesorhizobium amorphae CCNWGS0123 TaxID=1082933 RepID=G6YID6_9HYPH|nr:hypothetical protein MEA186_28782 [Mesorhizobium amorphae CCNWGS0123]
MDVVASVAIAWLDEEQRAMVRDRLTSGTLHGDPAVRALVEELAVSKHAVALVANKPDSKIVPSALRDR